MEWKGIKQVLSHCSIEQVTAEYFLGAMMSAPYQYKDPDDWSYLEFIGANGAADAERVGDRWADRDDDDP